MLYVGCPPPGALRQNSLASSRKGWWGNTPMVQALFTKGKKDRTTYETSKRHCKAEAEAEARTHSGPPATCRRGQDIAGTEARAGIRGAQSALGRPWDSSYCTSRTPAGSWPRHHNRAQLCGGFVTLHFKMSPQHRVRRGRNASWFPLSQAGRHPVPRWPLQGPHSRSVTGDTAAPTRSREAAGPVRPKRDGHPGFQRGAAVPSRR